MKLIIYRSFFDGSCAVTPAEDPIAVLAADFALLSIEALPLPPALPFLREHRDLSLRMVGDPVPLPVWIRSLPHPGWLQAFSHRAHSYNRMRPSLPADGRCEAGSTDMLRLRLFPAYDLSKDGRDGYSLFAKL